MKKYKFITNQVSGVPQGAIRMLNSSHKNTQTWLKFNFIKEVKEVKEVKKVDEFVKEAPKKQTKKFDKIVKEAPKKQTKKE